VAEAHVNLRALLLLVNPAFPSLPLLGLIGVLGLVLGGQAARWLPRSSEGLPLERAAWAWLAVAALTNVLAPYNHITGLVILLPPALLLLARGEPTRERSLLALLLAAPSVGIILAVFNTWLYVGTAWLTALGCLALGLKRARG
jgi:xanthosine utilization system XapX-like protein